MSTVGEEFKDATLDNLVRIARIALERHEFLSRHTITSVDDVAAFDHDFTDLEIAVREIGVDVKKCGRWYRNGQVETTKYIFTAPVDREFEADTLERIIEDFRAYAFPTVWGYTTAEDRHSRVFRCEFEIEDRERKTHEYLDEVRNQMLTWFGVHYEIVEVEG